MTHCVLLTIPQHLHVTFSEPLTLSAVTQEA